MTDPQMKKFIALYLVPSSVIADWAKTDPEKKKAAEQAMQADWGRWMQEHAGMISDTGAGGRTKRVTETGVSETKNDILMYSFVEAESHEAAAKAFENHPHLRIPQSSIEVMSVRPLDGM
jgi:hypothetical protein